MRQGGESAICPYSAILLRRKHVPMGLKPLHRILTAFLSMIFQTFLAKEVERKRTDKWITLFDRTHFSSCLQVLPSKLWNGNSSLISESVMTSPLIKRCWNIPVTLGARDSVLRGRRFITFLSKVSIDYNDSTVHFFLRIKFFKSPSSIRSLASKKDVSFLTGVKYIFWCCRGPFFRIQATDCIGKFCALPKCIIKSVSISFFKVEKN